MDILPKPIPHPTYPRFKDLTGQQFHRLEALYLCEMTHNGAKGARQPKWLCRCQCGIYIAVIAPTLRSGDTQSCGCLNREQSKNRLVTHGLSDTREYRCWGGMKARCLNSNDKSYHRYGGRGITVCERWLRFENFYADMGRRPSAKHSLERIDNEGGYKPENCRWATPTEQAKNRRSGRWITYKGKTLCLHDWAKERDIKVTTLRQRFKYGWTIERALETPVRAQRSRRQA